PTEGRGASSRRALERQPRSPPEPRAVRVVRGAHLAPSGRLHPAEPERPFRERDQKTPRWIDAQDRPGGGARTQVGRRPIPGRRHAGSVPGFGREDEEPSAPQRQVGAGLGRVRANTAREERGRLVQAKPRVLGSDLGRERGSRRILRRPLDLAPFDSIERLGEAIRSERGEARAEGPRVLVPFDRGRAGPEDRPLVQSLGHPHRRDTRLRIARDDRRLNGRRAPPSRKKRVVKVQRAEPRDREERRRKDLAVRRDDEQVRGERADLRERVRGSGARGRGDGETERLRGPADRGRTGLEPASARLVGTGDDEDRRAPVAMKALERRHRQRRRAVVDEAHGARQNEGSSPSAPSGWPDTGALKRLSLASTSFRLMGLKRSTKRMPSRWSSSCCTARARNPWATSVNGSPRSSRASTTTRSERFTSSRIPGMLRHPSSPVMMPSRSRMTGFTKARRVWPKSSSTSTTKTRSDRPTCGAARPTPFSRCMQSNMASTKSAKSASNEATGVAFFRRIGSP